MIYRTEREPVECSWEGGAGTLLPTLSAYVVATGVLVWLSRRSLRRPSSHGFFRLLAWEAVLGMICLNWRYWLQRPFSALQLASWLLLTVSAVIAVQGVVLLKRRGKAEGGARAEDPQLLGFERTTLLVTSGIYRYIRHPLYASILFLGWGVFLKRPSFLGLVLAIAATLLLFATARAEERECRRYFGVAYSEYVARTRMFVPYVL